ncbi:type II secretion system protein [Soehngenia longivitae]|uniref:Type II secretion system protein n=1 Tax=Soehngenia longivitae TaxID=2562294 RepID=A0A4Z0D708_9FIRM|nr:type II secretion system protein [Soehngenia longivitae]TFZ40681.1 type II secretion system protein [Soehngenia longivitae]
MKGKGYTLIELILSIALLGLIATYFITSISFGYKNIVNMEDRTINMYTVQQNMENTIKEKKKLEPTDPQKNFEIFDKTISAHEIKLTTSNNNEIIAYIPKETINYNIPVLSSDPVIKINEIDTDKPYSPQPLFVDVLDFNWELFVAEVPVTDSTKPDHLMSVYRWYISDEIQYSPDIDPGDDLKRYFAIKEWNEAKKQLPYAESEGLSFIPNIKANYNRLSARELKTNLGLSDKELIDRFGNRYFRYGITPYSIAGRIGEEKISNYVYVTKPIIVESATFDMDKTIEITFNQEVRSPDISEIKLNGVFANWYNNRYYDNNIKKVKIDDADKKKLIITLNNKRNNITLPIGGNSLQKGAVQSISFGEISIYNGEDGTFEITNK